MRTYLLQMRRPFLSMSCLHQNVTQQQQDEEETSSCVTRRMPNRRCYHGTTFQYRHKTSSTTTSTSSTLNDARTQEAGVQQVSQLLLLLSTTTTTRQEEDRQQMALNLVKELSPSCQLELQKACRELLSETWVEEQQQNVPTPPSQRDLYLVMMHQMIPFIGFGIMDNSILIVAGDVIDQSLGVTLGLSTLCAAALGNIVSDVAGVGFGAVIEEFSHKYVKLPIPQLTSAQRQLRVTRIMGQTGTMIGLVIGCLIGMFPLLFMNQDGVQKKKVEATSAPEKTIT